MGKVTKEARDGLINKLNLPPSDKYSVQETFVKKD